MYPLGELIEQAIKNRGLSKIEVVIKVGYHNLNKGLHLLDDLIDGKALGYRHTPMRHLPEVLNISQEEFDASLAKWYELKKIAWEDDNAKRGIYNERTFRPHLWIWTSRQTPQPIFPAAIGGEAMFKHVRLPEGAVGENGEVDFALVGQVIRDHYHKRKGSALVFGDIVSYFLRLSYGKPGIKFSPDGQIIDTNPPPVSHGEASLTIGNKEIPREFLDKLAETIVP
jgi:hypothetical protein